MGFTALSAANTRRIFRRLGDACMVTPKGGDPIATFGILEQRTAVVGDLGHILDERPTIELLREDVGQLERGSVVLVNGKTYGVDKPVPLGATTQNFNNADDGLIVRYYLREQSDG